ncbi:hypothetical protein ACF1BS_04345 [Streptomyces sp. NPDC014748]|uniref:hypothetical protein n=1 Tax=Streptomyces sp. NPDC014748 TaxID=3364905 RepID=UPI0036FDA5FD
MTTHDVPAGPVEKPPRGFRISDEQAALLRDTLTAAGIDLGEWENTVVTWLSMWEWATVATICSWVARAAQRPQPTPVIALPGRFDATPAEVDQHLRRILAEDVYLRYQQAIGRQAVTEALTDARTTDLIDPAKHGGPYPAKLLCSQHDGFGPCPGAPRCTPQEDAKGAAA